MSRVVPSSGDAVEATPRKGCSRKEREQVIAKSDGHCSYPGCESTDRLEIDHVIALFLGGKESIENYAALCYAHHKQKTALDQRLAAKVRRLRIKQEPREFWPKAQKFPKRKLRGRWSGV